jgi:hypothetical protein
MNAPSYEADLLVTPAAMADPYPFYRHLRAAPLRCYADRMACSDGERRGLPCAAVRMGSAARGVGGREDQGRRFRMPPSRKTPLPVQLSAVT